MENFDIEIIHYIIIGKFEKNRLRDTNDLLCMIKRYVLKTNDLKMLHKNSKNDFNKGSEH